MPPWPILCVIARANAVASVQRSGELIVGNDTWISSHFLPDVLPTLTGRRAAGDERTNKKATRSMVELTLVFKGKSEKVELSDERRAATASSTLHAKSSRSRTKISSSYARASSYSRDPNYPPVARKSW